MHELQTAVTTLSDLPPDALVAVARLLRRREDQHALYCAFRAARDALGRAAAAEGAATAIVVDMADALRTGDDRTVAQRLLETGVPAPLRKAARTVWINDADLADLPPLSALPLSTIHSCRFTNARAVGVAEMAGALRRFFGREGGREGTVVRDVEVDVNILRQVDVDVAEAIGACIVTGAMERLDLRVWCSTIASASSDDETTVGPLGLSLPRTLTSLSVDIRTVCSRNWASPLLRSLSASLSPQHALRNLMVRQQVCDSRYSSVSLEDLGRGAPALSSVRLDLPKHSIAGVDALLLAAAQLETLSLTCRALVPPPPSDSNSSPHIRSSIGLRVLHLNVGGTTNTSSGHVGSMFGVFEAFRADALEELVIEWPNAVSAASTSFLSSASSSLARLRIDGIPGHVSTRQVLLRVPNVVQTGKMTSSLRSFSAPGMMAFTRDDFAAIVELLPPCVRELELKAVPNVRFGGGLPELPAALKTLVIADGSSMPSPSSWASLGELLVERRTSRIRLVVREQTAPTSLTNAKTQAFLRCESKEELDAMAAAARVLATAGVRHLTLVGGGGAMLAPHVLARLRPLGETVEEVRIDGGAAVCARGLEALRAAFPLMNAL